jgi:hypothetical protein
MLIPKRGVELGVIQRRINSGLPKINAARICGGFDAIAYKVLSQLVTNMMRRFRTFCQYI